MVFISKKSSNFLESFVIKKVPLSFRGVRSAWNFECILTWLLVIEKEINVLLSFIFLFPDNNVSTSNCGTITNMNKRHLDDSSLSAGGSSSRIALSRSCSSPAVSHGKSSHYNQRVCVYAQKSDVNLWNFGWFKLVWIPSISPNSYFAVVCKAGGNTLKRLFCDLLLIKA